MSNIFGIKLRWGDLCDRFLKCYEIWGSSRFKSHFVVGQVVLDILKEGITFIHKDWAIQGEFSNSLLHLVKSFTFLGILCCCHKESKLLELWGESSPLCLSNTGWGISRLTPLYPTNGLSCAPGSQYTLYLQPLYTASQVCTTNCSWDKGVLTDLCLTRVLTDLCLTLYNQWICTRHKS